MADIVQLGLALDASKVLKSRDQTNRALDSIARSSKKTQTAIDGTQKAFGRMVRAFGTVVAFGLVRGLFREIAESIEAGEQSAAKLNSVLAATGFAARRTASDINVLSQAMADNTLFNDDEIRDTAAILLTFRKVQGEVFDEALAAIADMAQVLGTDLKSAALQVGKVLQDPVARIGEMSRAGITFTKAQKEMVRAMVEAGDQAGAQRVILNELKMEFGGAAAGANVGLFASINQTRKAWIDFLEVMGRTPAVTGPAGSFLEFLTEGLENLTFAFGSGVDNQVLKLQQNLDDLQTLQERGRTKGGLLGMLGITRELTANELVRIAWRIRQIKELLADLQAQQRELPPAPPIVPDTTEDDARLKRLQDAARKWNAEQRALAAAWEKSWGRAIENTQDSFAEFFKSLLTGGVSSFEEFAKQVLDIWIDLTAQIAATKLFQAFLSTGLGQSLAAPGTPELKTADDFLQASASPGGDFASQAGGVTVRQSFTFNVAAMDAASFAQFAEQNKAIIAGAAAKGARDSVGIRRMMRGR